MTEPINTTDPTDRQDEATDRQDRTSRHDRHKSVYFPVRKTLSKIGSTWESSKVHNFRFYVISDIKKIHATKNDGSNLKKGCILVYVMWLKTCRARRYFAHCDLLDLFESSFHRWTSLRTVLRGKLHNLVLNYIFYWKWVQSLFKLGFKPNIICSNFHHIFFSFQNYFNCTLTFSF